ncbi:DUF4124 domain-containing protein [Pseudoalteromonas arctica]|uniref:DUF4124 domain-containing protein n=1 Tax=Pseudoalteromonas TaxID=53246 RepID=UPI000231B217|nr:MULTISPECIES: DUF4124 domain-containing protein [Pseudoalteromonas]NMP79178.1 DUF4124 domain-containing protein [Pseudoalteromonas arctica]GAA69085.1 hypothetical protein P20429_3217 [Pseudoalteromonas sp. BSi20429]
MIKIMFTILLFSSFVLQAKVYKCEDELGKVSFTDIPCEQGDESGNPQQNNSTSQSPIINKTPKEVNSIKEALNYVGWNQIVLLNLDLIEQQYITPKKSFNFEHSFLAPSRYQYSTVPIHSVTARFINGLGEIIYQGKIYTKDFSSITDNNGFFNATFSDINKRMMEMGLEDQTENTLRYGRGNWRWTHRNFACHARSDFNPKSSIIGLKITCKTNK